MKFLLLLSMAFLGCAGFPPFKEVKTDEVGYKITPVKNDNIFFVKAILPDNSTGNYGSDYVFRAVGESCKKRGYDFFSGTPAKESKYNGDLITIEKTGYCYKENKGKGFGIQFENIDSNSYNAGAKVYEMNNKVNSKLKIGDLILEIEGKKITSVADVKSMTNNTDKNSLKLTIIRDKTRIEVEEALIVMQGSFATPDDLVRVRKYVRD